MTHKFPVLREQWRQLLISEIESEYFLQLEKRVLADYAAGPLYPPLEQIFSAFELCEPEKLRVVIIGQDPYHAAGQAHGLCFSVNAHVRIPPSLKNIFKELQSDISGFEIPASGNLSAWASQGVLLLNAVLTVMEGRPGSHRSIGWERFTDAVIRTISAHKQHVVFMLWGSYAIAKKNLINEQRHLVLTAPHPSPLARGGFFNCRHFSKTNSWLQRHGLPEIDWRLK